MDAKPPVGPPAPRSDPHPPPTKPIAPKRARATSFGKQFLGAMLVLLAGAIAFVATCFPLGAMDFNLHRRAPSTLPEWLPWAAGAVAGLAAGGVCFRFVTRRLDRG